MNKVFISGNLTRDAEANYSQSGLCIAKLGVAVNDRRKNSNGEWENVANFVDCTMFGTRAEKMKDILTKGTKVFIEGKLNFSQWESKDGQKRSKLDVVVQDIELMRAAKDSGTKAVENEFGVEMQPYSQEEIPF